MDIAQNLMKTTKLFLATLLLLPFFLLASKAEMPQDHWYFNGMTISGNFGALAIGPDGNLYAATNG